jgi:kynurenine 3-monooxygenase
LLLSRIFWLLLFLCCHDYRHDDDHAGASLLFSSASALILKKPLSFHSKTTLLQRSSSVSGTTYSSSMLATSLPSSSSLLFSLSFSDKEDEDVQTIDASSSLPAPPPLSGLRVAIVGGGPSGLLLAHRLLQSGATVNLYEKRPRPTTMTPPSPPEQKIEPLNIESSSSLSPLRAYALGIGIRGRTAIQSVDQGQLWQAVTDVGYASERFILHVGPFAIRLRDESDSIIIVNGNDSSCAENAVEPSLLLFQSDLCRVLADELERRWASAGGGGEDDTSSGIGSAGRLNIMWNCAVQSIDLRSKRLVTETNSNGDKVDYFDLLVGCDGVNSVVRRAMKDSFPKGFETRQELIPGLLKVVKLDTMPPFLDPAAVQLLFPKSGAVTAFVEPTANGTCCVLFAGRNGTDVLLSSDNATCVVEELKMRFPKLIGADLQAAAEQMVQNKNPSQASLVTCNTYHCGSAAVLVGDAAHATGSVSGQGVNSALVDAAVLADCLTLLYDRGHKHESLGRALLAFSQRAVPEGKALYDLSFGPQTSTLKKLQLAFSSARDSIFKGRFGIGEKPLQTMLTTSLRSFSDIRRQRDRFYEEKFMDEASWNATLANLDTKLKNEERLSS